MNIKITADSTCDLSADILKEYNIAITPPDGHQGRDGVY